MLNKQTEFFNGLRESHLRKQGFDLLIIYAQASLECGNFTSELVLNANNPFSIKATPKWKGDTYLLKNNPEVIEGKEVIIPDVFRKYPTMKESIYDYVDLIERLYPESYASRADYQAYYYNLQHHTYHYATDPLYVEKLIKMYQSLDQKDFKEVLNGSDVELWCG